MYRGSAELARDHRRLRLWLFEVWPSIVGRRRSGRGFTSRLGSGSGLRTFAVRFFQVTIRGFLRAAGIIVGLLRFAVFIDRALALTEQIKNHAEIDVSPNFGPFFRGLGH